MILKKNLLSAGVNNALEGYTYYSVAKVGEVGSWTKNADRFERKHEWLFAVSMGVILGVAIWGSLL